MRTLIFAIIFLCPTLFGQQNDFSVWTRSTAGETVVIPWYMHLGKKAVVDVRYNFDAKNTAGICLGKKWGDETITVIPEACGYIGDLNGFGPEFLVLGSKGRINLFSQNQYIRGSLPSNSFVYHWVDLVASVNKYIALGVDYQVFKLTNVSAPTAVDIGPAAKITVGKMYFRLWPCWGMDPKDANRRGNPTLFLGVGYVW